MRQSIVAVLLVMSLSIHAQSPVNIIPYPQQVRMDSGVHDLKKLSFFYTNIKDVFLINEFTTFFRSFSPEVRVSYDLRDSGIEAISDTALRNSLGDEGYRLLVTARKISIAAATEAGIFYGLQSLKQLSALSERIPCMAITDYPKFEWRGTMIDIARSFFDPAYLTKHIDRMALYKFNRLHLHLTDDQGWRIEIKSWPRLVNHGAGSAVEGGRAGYLTQREYVELQQYAAQRNVIIVPEIDMPGHIYAALASYPELNCPDQSNIDLSVQRPPKPYTGTKVGWNKLCLGNPEIYGFVGDVVAEVANITGGKYLHFGGDEIEDPLYPVFVAKADSIVRSYGKVPVGWEEVLKGKVSKEVISQVWHGKGPETKGNPWIMSLCEHFYLDHSNYPGQPETQDWCKADGIGISDVYFNVSPSSGLLGIEAAVWTEFIHTEEKLDIMLWPRLVAVAEVAWSDLHDPEDFLQRLSFQAPVFRKTDIRFHKFENISWK